jgi:glutamyl-tRNA(Gln) amidotransferase subunit E
MHDYKKLGLKCGIEIHQQLEGKKLFCSCPTILRDDLPKHEVKRKIRASAGESGKVDIAAAQEQIKNKTFIYQGYDTTCLVELDEEPPHPINQDALNTVLQFSKLVGCKLSPIVQIMRKTIVNGSITSGFQRTALIARKGSFDILDDNNNKKSIGVTQINIEEDAARQIHKSKNENEVIFRLDRQGIPLIEVTTDPDIRTPKECQNASKKIGMYLRSLPGVKRGLGTIRQDVNVSITGGERVEIKGAQDLKTIPQLVDLEIKRQVELIKLKKELTRNKIILNKLNIVDLTNTLKNCQSKIIKSNQKNKGAILGFKVREFKGLIGRELQPNYRVGSELSGRAKMIAGVGGIFHSDELPNYGIEQTDVDLITSELKCTKNDAFIIVATTLQKATLALQAAYNRLEELYIGIPKEVRKANDNQTTSFLRPMPGAARMYPETDVTLIRPSYKNITIPELLDQKIPRFQKDYKLTSDLANHIVKSNFVDLFEELANKYPKIKTAYIADILTSMLTEIKRKYKLNPDILNEDHFRQILKHLSEDTIHKDIILDVLIDMIKGNFDIKKYKGLSTEDIHKELSKIIKANPKAPMGALMGQAMKALAGKASGQIISKELRYLMTNPHK